MQWNAVNVYQIWPHTGNLVMQQNWSMQQIGANGGWGPNINV